jgi:subtilisin family serine protease
LKVLLQIKPVTCDFLPFMFIPKSEPFAGFTGSGVRVAIIDSGVNPAHPHVGGVSGGVHISSQGESEIYLDYLGHGTAVAGAIREKAPDALLYAVKVFDQALATNIETIIRAIEWAIGQQMHVINLSLGTLNPAHRQRFERIIAQADAARCVIVAAREMSGRDSLPGSLASVIGVGLDWDCPRETYRCTMANAHPIFFASGYPRSIPGVAPERNLNGMSFAVANMTGFVARAAEAVEKRSLAVVERALIEAASSNPLPPA